ncbi:MAG: hypothetical protein HQL26_05520 [Candidatus Omnitrophica bacterium]|nr:hypothetical protein [Candidatus Omnitrophota bacterium]
MDLTHKFTKWLCLSIIIFTGIIFILSEFHTASQKKFWPDETVGINGANSPHSYLKLIAYGPPGEASPSPLYYVLLRLLDGHKTQIHIPELIYFRLPSIFITVFVAWLVCFLFWKEIGQNNAGQYIKSLQYAFLLAIPIRFLFEEEIYYYAMETRVYALWNSLWFLCLFFLLNDKHLKYAIATLIILAFTATGISFQITALILAYIIVNAIEGGSVKKIFFNSIKIFAAPLCIILYYGLKVPHFNYLEDLWGTWPAFFKFWLGHSRKFYILIFIGILCLLKEKTRKFSLIPLTMIILYLIAPGIYYVTRAKGCFLTDRQYIYYHLVKILGLIVFIKLIPFYVDLKTNRRTQIYSAIFISIGIGCTINKTFLAFMEGLKNAFLPG